MINYEKLGVFYLGRELKSNSPLLFESKDLTTHAVIVGMTGSGKTGLGIGLLEEAAIDKIPALIIDPKGDVGNLLLTFPDLKPEDFEKWGVEDGKKTAFVWEEGLKAWNEDKERIKRLKESVEFTIYTPGSRMGKPISILDSFDAPSKEEMEDEETFQNRIAATAAGLLNLIGIDADPIKSREHILISALLNDFWKKGKSLDLATLIALIQKPPFEKIGVLDIETFYPIKDRLQLSMSLNSLLAAPGFQAWLEGDPLDVQKLLYTEQGEPRH
ncbi:MAG: helicase HerA domain-containing protein, partial [Parachlamydiaceae bacterium]